MQSSPRLASFIHFDPPSQESQGTSRSRAINNRTNLPSVASVVNISQPGNKRGQIHTQSHAMIDNEIIRYCRSNDWASVIRRCRTHPEEAVPVIIIDGEHSENRFDLHAAKRCIKPGILNDNRVEIVYRETALGIATACYNLDTDTIHEVIMALIMACPYQIRASQLIPGHTPLRDAILNPKCDPFTLRALLDADEMCHRYPKVENFSALVRRDRNGLLPMDHLIATVQIGPACKSLQLISEYFSHQAHKRVLQSMEESPLIRLFTTASGFDQEAVPSRVLQTTKLLLDIDDSFLFLHTKVTGCSPIHAALRHFGNFLPLVKLLTSRLRSVELMAHRNNFGDLPLHVACTVGVPFEVLQTVISHTIAAAKPSGERFPLLTHPLAWSVNKSGYTPIELEWMRHIEGGQGMNCRRSFYPVEPSGIRRHCFKQDDYYRDLLRQSVEHTMKQDVSKFERLPLCSEHGAYNTFGTLLDRLSLLISAASSSVRWIQNPLMLHQACKLVSSGGPSFPGPLIELFLWLHRDHALQRDHFGLTPLNYLLGGEESAEQSLGTNPEWCIIVRKFLDAEPRTARVATPRGRLPLHCLLIHAKHGCNSSAEVLKRLVECYPESIEHADTITGLSPFQLAAANPAFDLDTVYFILRRSPAMCVKFCTRK